MKTPKSVNRRLFLRTAGLTALAGTVRPGVLLAGPAASNAYDFDTPYERFGTGCVKWDQPVRLFGKENVNFGMGVADMDFRVAPVITKALKDRLQHENWGYLDTAPYVRGLAETIATWNKKHYGVTVDPDSVVVSTGVHPAVIAALQTFSPPGTKVLVQTPTYDGFYTDITFAKCIAEESPLRLVNDRYEMDFEDLERRITADTRTLILCNPQNPTGNCWSPEDLLRVGEICLKRGVIVLSDEIHCDFVNKGRKYTPFASLPNRDVVRNSITFKAASKSFGLAAMKCGWMYSDNMDLIKKVRANHRADLNTLGLVASKAACEGGEEWLSEVRTYLDGNLEFADNYIRSSIPLLRMTKPDGTYLGWVDVSQLARRIGADEMAAKAPRNAAGKAPTAEVMVQQYLMKHARVHMNPGSNYGLGGAGHMRMNVATSRKTLQAALTAIANALRTL